VRRQLAAHPLRLPPLAAAVVAAAATAAGATSGAAPGPVPATLTADARAPLPWAVPEVWGTLIFWDYRSWLQDAPLRPDLHAAFPFVREIELFTATGGCYAAFPNCSGADRDLFVDPAVGPASGVNATPLVAAIGRILAANFSVYVVTGNVPVSMSAAPHIGTFGVNDQPPADFPAYRDYLTAVAGAAVDAFGVDTVRSKFRWGVFTEYNNNGDWLKADPSAFWSLYAYTACALEAAVGAGAVTIGGHACTQCSPPNGAAWNASLLLQFATSATNPCTGGVGAPLAFIADSFYETRPGAPGDLSWFGPQVDQLRNATAAVGLAGKIAVGIDEGRILLGPAAEGPALALTTRAVGDSYQASFDALLFTSMVRRNMSWYARWGVDTLGGNGLWGGGATPVDTAAGNLARLCHRMAGGAALAVTNATAGGGPVVDAAASYHAAEAGGVLRVLAFNHWPALDTAGAPGVAAAVAVCGFAPGAGGSVPANVTRVDDAHANFWPTWWADRAANNITDINAGWSAYSDSISLGDAANRSWWEGRAPAYQALAALAAEPVDGGVVVGSDGCARFTVTLPPHGVALVEAAVGPVAGGA
jgi:hypothetical protein